ncbi:riboflavin synthase, alpha subunit [Alkaliphilus metalliredigens QYMF]|uniref:Riboflavin synthase n=1 Tax=Alkaliphilus metalliredigens (strain QYMF) TaxID=293826 RepID=A6TM18_ALKMQ|nr:riboflavin synthase [Alkaliphilus metalliredigens]ABR47236.1 riboflavin synthase, alpha subunit [Alkaliphilus metalliredigens QYMF]
MFTGLIEEIGTVEAVRKGSKSAQLTIKAKQVVERVKLGDSISTNGVCLTVVEFGQNGFTVDVMPETMRRSNLKNVKHGSSVNLERALKLGDRLGGHMVSGHIDGVGIIQGIEEEDNATWVTIKAPIGTLKYVIEKGSIAIDGTSLTVAYVDQETLKVSIIPLTRDETTLLSKKVGEEVNLECDMVGKYIERLTMFKEAGMKEQTSAIDMNFLQENGFA